uniref:Zinc finger protein 385D n=1 Tax=Gasterosteus aculeatus aculeatus TaxID=481459 RepID=A0AAQ4PPW1_GASAC
MTPGLPVENVSLYGSVALPPLARPTPGRVRLPPDPQPLVPFHLLPGFTNMDHIRKAVMGPGFGLTAPLKRKLGSCGFCPLRCNPEAQAPTLSADTKNSKRLKAMDTPDLKIRTSEPVARETTSQILPSPCLQPSSADTGEPTAANPPSEVSSPGSGPADTFSRPSDSALAAGLRTPEPEARRDGEMAAAPEHETEEEKALRLLYCSLCKVAVNSASQLHAHNRGTKHKTMLQARSGEGAIKSFPRTGVKAKLVVAACESPTGLQNKTFHCEICDVHVNSETQLKQHISSRRHKDRAAGKPAKPKFSPHAPVQHHQGLQAICLALQKKQDLTKPLASCLLQRRLSQHPVAAAAAMVILPPFPLRPASNSRPALFQSQTLPQALLHTAPGPICSAHTPVLFSPY